MKIVFLILLLGTIAAALDDENIRRQCGQYWGDRGLENPPRRLRELADWALLYYNATTEYRPVLLFTIATPASISSVLPRMLENLAKFKSHDQLDTNGNDAISLAEHTLVATTNADTQRACDSLKEKYHHNCYELDHGYNSGVQDTLTLGNTQSHAYSVGLSRMKSLLDLNSLGYDVLYFDLHHLFFQNPLKYLYANTRSPIVVSTTPVSGCRPLVRSPDGSLPHDHHRLDIAFLRSNPAAFRCLYNWLYWSTHSQHDAKDRPLDHHTFRNVMQECVQTLGPSVMSVEYLDPAAFPSVCATKCGCKDGAPVLEQPGSSACPKDVMANWVAYLFSCTDSAATLDSMLVRYSSMYIESGLSVQRH